MCEHWSNTSLREVRVPQAHAADCGERIDRPIYPVDFPIVREDLK